MLTAFRYCLFATLVLLPLTPPVLSAQHAEPAWKDPLLSTDERTSDLIPRLTLEEKVALLQDNSPAIGRLGIPAYTWGNEGLHGDAFTGYMTLFPQVIGIAATWDPALVQLMGNAIGVEARARFNTDSKREDGARFTGISFWAPNINIFRDPRWGRGQETYGEDPFLTATLGTAYVKGLQGEDPKYLLALAGPKHLAVHSGPESERHKWNSYVSPHDLEDTYLPAFHAVLSEGHAGSVMCAYNRINGTPACASSWLLTDTLRQKWGFNGFVISDCGAIADISTGHHFAPDNMVSSADAIRAGMDSACDWVPDGKRSEYSYLLEAANHGMVPATDIDRALRNVLRMRFRLGLLDPPEMVPFSRITPDQIGSREHKALALQAAREAIVLLDNHTGVLPLRSTKKIAVIGPDADLNQSIEGNYNAVPRDPITPLRGIQEMFARKAEVAYAQGSLLTADFPLAVAYTALHPNAEASEFGLEGEYFSNTSFSGAPVVTRIDRHINFDWDKAEPAPGMPSEDYSVRWTGTITLPSAGEYGIGAKVRGCTDCQRELLKLYLDGKLLLQEGDKHIVKVHSDARPHQIRLEYIHRRVPTHHLIAGGVDLLWLPPAAALRDQAVATAKDADVIVACLGLSPELEGEELPVKLPGFDAGDRTDLSLPVLQDELLQSLAATGKPVVVVLLSGSAVTIPSGEKAAAVLEAWYPGQAGGTAIAQTLSGDNNPSGRLPVTFYANVSQLPSFGSYNMENRTYRYFTGKPAYGFGYGLSYSKFTYSKLELSNEKLTAPADLKASVHVKNISDRAGDEVAEFYLSPPPMHANPRLRLVAFQRVHLEPGEEKVVSVQVSPAMLDTVGPDGTRRWIDGGYQLTAGGAQPSEAASSARANFSIEVVH